MTLKEKFKLIEGNSITWSAFYDTQVQIADEFAIEFAEWADENYFKVGNKSIWIEDLDSDIIITSKELLEIFKKEKGW